MYDDMMQETNRNAAPEPRQAGLMPMLSVFLLVLAFFIMMISMVEYDDRRTQAALGSLSATFNARSADPADVGSGAGVGEAAVTHRISDEIGKVLKTLLSDEAFKIDVEGIIAVVHVDNDALFARALTPAPAFDRIVGKIAAIIAAAPQRFDYEISVIEPLGEAGATQRSGIVVRALQAAGIAPERLMTGLAIAEPGRTRIEIYTLQKGGDADSVRSQSRGSVR